MIDDGRSKNKVLLCAYPKTGNHWITLVVSNYYNLLNFPEHDRPLTLSDMYGHARFKGWKATMYQKGYQLEDFAPNYPTFVRVEHSRYDFFDLDVFFNSFDKLVYLWRNPLDVMISHFYYLIRNREQVKHMKHVSLKGHAYFENYARANLLHYIAHVKYNRPRAHLVLHYDSLLHDPSPFKVLLGYLFKTVDETIFKKAIQYSSFQTIHAHEVKITEPEAKFMTRDGRSKQYVDYMTPKLIEEIKHKWKEEGLGNLD